MTTLIDPAKNSEIQAILELKLPDTVAAVELQALLAIAQFVYSSELWLAQAEEQEFGVPMPDEDFVPEVDDRLIIEFLEIGTPNKLTFKGRMQGIAAIATVLTTLIGLPTAGAVAYKTYAEAQKINAETEKILEETEILKLQRDKAQRLEKDGRITEESLRYKEHGPKFVAHYYTLALPLLVKQKLRAKKT
jgi:hypothetical protein